jgi:hypothetical protein
MLIVQLLKAYRKKCGTQKFTTQKDDGDHQTQNTAQVGPAMQQG